MAMLRPLPPEAEWATKPYSYIAPHGAQWAAFCQIGDDYQLWHLGSREDVLTKAKKQGNRVRRLREKSNANVATG
jgi:hypothetical protein